MKTVTIKELQKEASCQCDKNMDHFDTVVYVHDADWHFQAVGIGNISFHCRICNKEIPPNGYMRTFQWAGEDQCKMCIDCDETLRHSTDDIPNAIIKVKRLLLDK